MTGCRRKKKGGDDDGKPKVPECMVTFADMITLMVTFFILLCTFAKSQDALFFADGIGSFRRATESMGLPGIMQSNVSPVTLGATRPSTEPSREPGSTDRWVRLTDRLLEESPDSIREALLDSLQGGARVILPGGVRFPAGSTSLPAGSRETIDKIAQTIAGTNFTVEILAFGDPGETSITRGLKTAIRRAETVGATLMEQAGLPPSKIEYTGLKPREHGTRIKDQGEEVLFRLKQP